MTRAQRCSLLCCFILHFALIAAISSRDTLALIADGSTIVSASPAESWRKCEAFFSGILGKTLADGNPARETLETYFHLAGVDASYGYFAPNVPDGYEMVFEVELPDGRVVHDIPAFESFESTLRMATLIDRVAQLQSDQVREIILRLLASSIWQRHPEAVRIRAMLGSIKLPTVEEYAAGQRSSPELTWAYDFRVTADEIGP